MTVFALSPVEGGGGIHCWLFVGAVNGRSLCCWWAGNFSVRRCRRMKSSGRPPPYLHSHWTWHWVELVDGLDGCGGSGCLPPSSLSRLQRIENAAVDVYDGLLASVVCRCSCRGSCCAGRYGCCVLLLLRCRSCGCVDVWVCVLCRCFARTPAFRRSLPFLLVRSPPWT